MAPYMHSLSSSVDEPMLVTSGYPVHHIGHTPVPIAICGMACRLPGGISTPQQFWDFIIAKRDARIPVPKSRYNAAGFHSDVDKPGSIKTE